MTSSPGPSGPTRSTPPAEDALPRKSVLTLVWEVGLPELAAAAAGLLAVLVTGLGAPGWVLVVLTVVVVGGLSALGRGAAGSLLGAGALGRILLLVAAGRFVSPGSSLPWWALTALVAAVVGEVVLARLGEFSLPLGVGLPGLTSTRAPRIPRLGVYLVNAGVAVVLVALTSYGIGSGWAFGLALVALVLTAAALTMRLRYIQRRRRADRRLRAGVTAYAPRFALHWDAAAGTGYQIGRWIPYLDRLGERYVVIVRNGDSFPEASRLTDRPVLLRRGAREMDAVMVDSLRAVFYVNNALQNVHAVRYPGLRHIQLNHGDSDKATSYNPVFRMFDKNFVAGQAAVDRFAAHGVSTSPDFFEIVGRPQVEDVEVAGPRPVGPAPRVLYAPTWAGVHADSQYSSLPIGPQIITALLARGCVVIYRPHPYTDRNATLKERSAEIRGLLAADTGRGHLQGAQVEREWTLTDCFNACDAMISDVSSVVPDFLYSEKPYVVTAMSGPVSDVAAELPLARGGYLLAGDGSNLDPVLDDLLGPDPAAAVRRELKIYYLGETAADGYASTFLAAARRAIA